MAFPVPTILMITILLLRPLPLRFLLPTTFYRQPSSLLVDFRLPNFRASDVPFRIRSAAPAFLLPTSLRGPPCSTDCGAHVHGVELAGNGKGLSFSVFSPEKPHVRLTAVYMSMGLTSLGDGKALEGFFLGKK
jgi:hypothetical protein